MSFVATLELFVWIHSYRIIDCFKIISLKWHFKATNNTGKINYIRFSLMRLQ